jgi:poly-gamma-glutamate synthesis protein (capsule biosynthesis protein)
MRRMQLCRPSQDDVAWMQHTLNREGRRFGTRVRLEQDGAFSLEWT